MSNVAKWKLYLLWMFFHSLIWIDNPGHFHRCICCFERITSLCPTKSKECCCSWTDQRTPGRVWLLTKIQYNSDASTQWIQSLPLTLPSFCRGPVLNLISFSSQFCINKPQFPDWTPLCPDSYFPFFSLVPCSYRWFFHIAPHALADVIQVVPQSLWMPRAHTKVWVAS